MNAHVINDPLAVIYNEGHWRINKVSPMHNLRYREVELKQYAFKIRQTFVSTVPSTASQKFTVQVQNQPLLRYSEEDSNGLMITVSSTQSSVTKLVYSAILLSWGLSINVDDAIHLPYMLERGEQRIGNSVKSTLQTLFDCNIKQYNFTQYQLLQFVFSFIECDTSRYTDPCALRFKLPQANFKGTVTLKFDLGDLNIIWNGIKEEMNRELGQVTLAYQFLQNQIYYTFNLDITVFDLCEVTLSKAGVKNTGVLKMKTPETVNAVFTVLNEIKRLEA